MKIARSVTRIRKFDSPTHPPHHWHHEDHGPDSGDDTINKKGPKSEEEAEGDEAAELPETSDEIARIYWKWFSSDKIIFRGRITTRSEFLPKTGKVKG